MKCVVCSAEVRRVRSPPLQGLFGKGFDIKLRVKCGPGKRWRDSALEKNDPEVRGHLEILKFCDLYAFKMVHAFDQCENICHAPGLCWVLGADYTSHPCGACALGLWNLAKEATRKEVISMTSGETRQVEHMTVACPSKKPLTWERTGMKKCRPHKDRRGHEGASG